ncbi:hypothetical protein [Flavihumibacter sp. UBA7668]|uniref:hypothetical protein n=1 Tax=Flavihumibacter sp. UBA7668 TaxID=1946542 RepID=UPI0025BD3C09|nr:hypothetical protein [Flavihumibacter sp. UBA7668]
MARQTGIFNISGKIGDQVFYYKNGKKLVRKAVNKETYTLSEGSRKTNKEFASAHGVSNLFKKAVESFLKQYADKQFINRLRGKLIEIINTGPQEKKGERSIVDGNLLMLKELEFNCHTSLDKLVKFSPVITIDPFKSIELEIPAIQLAEAFSAPDNATHVVLSIQCCSFDLAEKNGRKSIAEELIIPLQTPTFSGGQLSITLEYIEERLVVLIKGVGFLSNKKDRIFNRRYYAGKILEAFYVRDGQILQYNAPPPPPAPLPAQDVSKIVKWKLQ